MSDKRKTLVLLTPGFAKDESDTTCLPMQQSFIKNLNKSFPDVNVIVLAFHYPYFKKTYQWFGNTVISFDGRNRGGFFKFFFWIRLNAQLKRIHRDHGIDGVLSFWYSECAFIGNRVARKYGTMHYCWSWGQDAKKNNRYASLRFLKDSELIVFSDFLKKEFEKNYGIKPAHVVTPGIDKKDFLFEKENRTIDIIAAGSLIPLKQYDIFIDIVSEIKKTIPGIKVILIGDGPEKARLKEHIRKLGLESTITLAGELPRHKVLEQMNKSKLFLHTSCFEGFGVVCLEALAAGADVISFVKPMNAEIGHWHIANNKDEMIDKAIGILNKPRSDYKAVIPYDIEDTVKKMAQLFSF